MEVTFRDGVVKRYDMAALFEKHPVLRALEERSLFCSGKLVGGLGIIWNEDLDIEVETIYQEGNLVRQGAPAPHVRVGDAVAAARAARGISQKELASVAGIDQSDISKIERGVANPAVGTLERIARALDAELVVELKLR